MSIYYIKDKDGTNAISAAEKIEVHYLNELKKNPWLFSRAIPIQSESKVEGGGTYKYFLPLGEDAATRRASGEITSNSISYNGNLKNAEKSLVVSEPFMTKAYPMAESNTYQLDGVDFSDIIGTNISESLVAAEIKEETSKITGATGILSIDGSSATKDIDQAKFVKSKIANYFAINADNADWAGATSDIKAYDYFTAKNGSFNTDEIRVHMHPAKIMDFSNAMTDSGSGSELQYQQFESGKYPVIGGVVVIPNKYISKDDVYIMIENNVASPDYKSMTTKIKTWHDDGNDVNVMKGWHWFDAIVLRPELITKISF